MQILIIDDEAHIRKTTAMTLETLGHDCEQAANSTEAVSLLKKGSFDAAFLDLRLGAENGLDLIEKILTIEPKLQVILFTAYSSIDTAVEAMRRGAVDYIAKPFTPEQIRQSIGRIENNQRLENRVVELESLLTTTSDAFSNFSTQEPVVQKLFETAKKAANSAATILLLGESGTGKSILARALHKAGRSATTRSSPSRVPVFPRNCSKANSSAMFAAPSPARSARRGARSRPPRVARSSSTKSANCRSRFSPSSSASCKSASTSASATPSRARRTSASSPPPIAAWRIS